MPSSFRLTRPAVRAATLAGAGLMVVFVAVTALVPVLPVAPSAVNIRWADALIEPARVDAARALGIQLIEVRDDGVWIATLADTSREAIRAIVQDPRVVDTHNIDRVEFDLASERVTLGGWLDRRFPRLRELYDEHVSDLIRPALLLPLALLVVTARWMRRALRGDSGWLTRGIPELSPYGLAAFRVAYGGAMMLLVSDISLGSLPREAHRLVDWAARNEIVRELSASPYGASSLETGLFWSLALFTLGVVPRAALALSAILLALLAAVMVTHGSIHNWGLPMVAMWLMLLVPWHEGFGVSWMWRRWRGRPEPVAASPRGLAVWLPPFALGVAFLAAAFAKLDASGLAWITDGAVRYHFVEDANAAPFDWGLHVAASDTAAVLVSLGAVLTETGFLAVIFFRGALVRAVFGLAGASLLTGFYLFQGVWWPAWWVLLMAFLPWSPMVDGLIARAATATRGVTASAKATAVRRSFMRRRKPPRYGYGAGIARDEPQTLSRAAVVVIGVVLVQQILVSAARIESEPFLSNFPMYASSWPSRDAFDRYWRETTDRYELVTDTVGPDELERRVDALPDGGATLDEALDAAVRGAGWRGDLRARVDAMLRAYRARYGTALGLVRVIRHERVFNWDRGTFEPIVTTGTLDWTTGTFRAENGRGPAT